MNRESAAIPASHLRDVTAMTMTWVKLLTDLQILGCELHKNAFGGRAPPGPAGGAIALPRPPSRYKVEGRVRKWLGTEYIGNTTRYDTRCYFNVRSKADMSQLNLPHRNNN